MWQIKSLKVWLMWMMYYYFYILNIQNKFIRNNENERVGLDMCFCTFALLNKLGHARSCSEKRSRQPDNQRILGAWIIDLQRIKLNYTTVPLFFRLPSSNLPKNFTTIQFSSDYWCIHYCPRYYQRSCWLAFTWFIIFLVFVGDSFDGRPLLGRVPGMLKGLQL